MRLTVFFRSSRRSVPSMGCRIFAVFWFAALAAAFVLAEVPLSNSAMAQESVREDRPPPACTSENSTETTIEEVNRNYDAWRGKCTQIDGLLFGRRIYASREATLDTELFDDDERANSRALALNPQEGFRLRRTRPYMVRIIGRIGSCQDAYDWLIAYQQENPSEVIMLAGLCHYTTENFIVPVRVVNLRKGWAVRLTEADVPASKRRLRQISPEELSAAAPYTEAAAQWIDAFASKDREAALRLQFVEYDELMAARDAGDPLAGLEDNFEIEESAYKRATRQFKFAALFRGVPPGRVFVENFLEETGAEVLSGKDGGRYFVCWCKGPVCDGKWPIAPWDSDNDPARPYFCLTATDYVIFRAGTAIQVEVPYSDKGFAEPSSPLN